MVRIESMYISGQTPRDGHAWNKVKLDGIWYNVDATQIRLGKNQIMRLLDTELEKLICYRVGKENIKKMSLISCNVKKIGEIDEFFELQKLELEEAE